MNFYEFDMAMQREMLLDENFLGSLKQGFQQSYQQAQEPQPSSEALQKFANVAMPAIQKVTGMAQGLSKKTGIPIPLATALLASGLVGGPAAVPFAALMYFVKRPLMAGASKGFDAGVAGVQKGAQMVKGAVQGMQPAAQPAMASAEMYFPSFADYYLYREGFGDWAGQKMGSMAGTVAGKTTGMAQKVGSVLSKSWQGLTKFASENKLAIAKTAFLMGVGALIGAGVGKLTHDAIDSVIQAVGDRGVPAEELNWLRHNFKMDSSGHEDAQGNVDPTKWVHHGKDGTAEFGGNGIYDTKGGDAGGNDWKVGEILPTMNVNAQELMDNMGQTTDGVLDKLKNTFGSFTRVDYSGVSAVKNAAGKYVAGRAADATGEMAVQYQVEILPKPGESSQSLLQAAYRELATKLHASGIKVTDMKSLGEDPSGAIKAALSVAPAMTGAGAIGGAAGMGAGPKPQQAQQQPQPQN